MTEFVAITLISKAPEIGGVFEARADQTRTVMGQSLSVSRAEAYAAFSHGFRPEKVFRLPYGFEYKGEDTLTVNGVTYRVIRTYSGSDNAIELTCERATCEVRDV